MDEQRFDDLARRLAGTRSRRSFLRGLLASIVAGAGGAALARPAVADSEPDSDRDNNQGRGCKRAGKNCKNDGQCCSGLICWNGGVCTPGCRIGGVQVAPGQLDPANACQACAPTTSTGGWTPVPYGTGCDDGDACTAPDICNGAGACTSTPLAPTIGCPQNQAVTTSGGICGAAVAFTVSSTCGTATCDHASGETFQVGETTVSCAVENAAGQATCAFTVTVTDDDAPQITCPPGVGQTATGPQGATVDFAVSAVDNCEPVTISCSPPSGSLFTIGTTQVSCTATDPTGLVGSCGFPVTVSCTPSCTGKNCGDSDGCGGTCAGPCPDPGPCASASCDDSNTCVTVNRPIGESCSNPCFEGAICNGSGACVDGHEPDCTPDVWSCQESTGCDPAAGGCTYRQLSEGSDCGYTSDACHPYRCTANGSCEADPVECDAECQTCVDGSCLNINEHEVCGGDRKLCHNGRCESPCGDDCVDYCYENVGSDGKPTDSYFCCPEELRGPGGFCCWVNGQGGVFSDDGHCTSPNQVCADGNYCETECCGGSDAGRAGACPSASQFCVNGQLLPDNAACTTDADCAALGYGIYSVCAGLDYTVTSEDDPVPIPNSGTCCPGGSYGAPDFGPGGGLVYSCCSAWSRWVGSGETGDCCGYPDYTGQCIDCQCSFNRISRCCF